MSMKRVTASVIALAAMASGGACAAVVTPADFGALHWRSIGPFRGGRVLAVAGASDDRLHFYFGAVNGGVWETRDAGRTWTPVFDDAPVGSIGALAVSPSAPKVLYAGSGEADMRSDIAQGVGMFKSTDGGKTWAANGLDDSQSIARILIDPRSPEVVLTAVLGHPYGPNEQRGVFHSADGGKTWRRTLFTNADTGATDLAFKPDDPNTVYAALWQTRRPPWNVYPPSSGPGGGLYKSNDNGLTWTPLSGHGLPDAPGRIGLATARSAPSRLYALIDAKEGGLYRSDDAGATWIKVNGDKRIWERGWYFSGLTVNPRNADEIWVCDTIVLHSTDGGRTFIPLKGDPTGDDFHALWIDPTDPNRRILGSDQGAQVTLNGGATWSSWYNQPTGQFYHVITDNRFPYRVYGAQQDSGAADIPSRADGWDGINMTHFHESAAGGESDNIAPDPNDPDTIYGGRVDKLDLRSGQVRDVDPTLAFPDGYRGTWTLPLVFGKRDHALYFANQRIFRTTDGGERWTPISPDLTRPDPGVPATLDAPTAADDNGVGPRKGVVYAIGPSPIAASDIWAGTDDGLVWRTRDGGGSWTNVTPSGMTAWSKIGVVEPSHFDPQVAYVAVDRHRLDDFAPHILRTRDGGKSWTAIVSGLADGGVLNAVNVVREDPVRRGLLYAGTERGAFVSLDDGEHWLPLEPGLPVTSVRDIDVHGADLVIASHGRGFYVMDDIEPLRELAADGGGATRLFKPAAAVRVRGPAFTGTPMPKDEPMAVNPPAGAYIDYALERAPAGPVEIAISDAHGDPVAKFSSADTLPPLDLAKISTAPEWIVRTQPPSAGAGAHRFVWDLRYALPATLKTDFRQSGVWAPPGRYTVTLTVDGKVFQAPLDVVSDPRVSTTAAANARQFALARAIEADRVKVRAALAAAKADPAGQGVAKALGPLAERLDELAGAVDGADGAPTPDAESGYRQASAALATALATAKP
jgi:photosystem II stability/assembly factor-like uncharacterized protein